jgi:hypothetical protein
LRWRQVGSDHAWSGISFLMYLRVAHDTLSDAAFRLGAQAPEDHRTEAYMVQRFARLRSEETTEA